MGAAVRNGQRTSGLGSLTSPKKAIFNEPYYERMGRREAAQGDSRAAYGRAAAERVNGRMHIVAAASWHAVEASSGGYVQPRIARSDAISSGS